MRRCAIYIIIGIIIGWWFNSIIVDKEVKIEAKKQFLLTESGNQIKNIEYQDSIKTVIDGQIKDEEINTKINRDKELVELASRYKDYTSEGIAKEIILIVSKYNQ